MMTSGNGADVPAALACLGQAGYAVAQLAADLGHSPSTLYRWRRGENQPRPANFAALVELVNARYGQAIHGRILASAVHLSAAYEALRTDADRSRREVTAARLAADQAAAEQRRQAAEAEKHAEVRELVTRQRQGQDDRIAAAVAAADGQSRRSAYADVDPLLIFGQQDDEMTIAERAFA